MKEPAKARVNRRAPGTLGYRMPAEWQRHFATWLAYPHHRTDWPGKLSSIPLVFAEMARVIAKSERVRLLVRDEAERERAEKVFSRASVDMSQVDFVQQATNRSWTRDSMPLWVTRKRAGENSEPTSVSSRRSERVAVNFRFDGWARYRDHLLDDEAGRAVANKYGSKVYEPFAPTLDGASSERVVLEGGSLDVDASGTLLTTEECLLTSSRARFSGTREDVEQCLEANLGIKKVLWLPQGIVGDDTSGHVDDFARLAPLKRLLICHESDK